MNIKQLPKDATLASSIVDGHFKAEEAKNAPGFIGKLFGGITIAGINVAATVAIISTLAMVLGSFLWAGQPTFSHKDAITAFSSLITLAIGYLFGRSTRSRSDD